MWSQHCEAWEATVPGLIKHPRDPNVCADGQPDHILDCHQDGLALVAGEISDRQINVQGLVMLHGRRLTPLPHQWKAQMQAMRHLRME